MERIQVYDNGGATCDRYTVVFLDRPEFHPGTFQCLGMSDHPFHPQGFCMHDAAVPGRHLGRRIRFEDLPRDCRRAVTNDLEV